MTRKTNNVAHSLTLTKREGKIIIDIRGGNGCENRILKNKKLQIYKRTGN